MQKLGCYSHAVHLGEPKRGTRPDIIGDLPLVPLIVDCHPVDMVAGGLHGRIEKPGERPLPPGREKGSGCPLPHMATCHPCPHLSENHVSVEGGGVGDCIGAVCRSDGMDLLVGGPDGLDTLEMQDDLEA